MNNKALQPYLWILLSGFAFSWMLTLAKWAGGGTSWQVVAIVRCAIPLVLIAVWAKCDGVPLAFFGTPTLWLRSISGSCSLVGTFYVIGTGMKMTDILTIANIFPIWVALLSWPMLGRMPSAMVWLSIVSSIAGVAVLQGGEIQAGELNVFVVVAVSMFTAVAMMGLNRLKNLDPRAIVVHFSFTALIAACSTLLVFDIEPPKHVLHEGHLLGLLGMGVAAAAGQYFLTKAFTAGDPARVSVANLVQFVFVALLDIFVLHNPLQWNKLWGIPLILGPTIWLIMQRGKGPASRDAEAPDTPFPSEATVANLAICADSTAAADAGI